MQKWEYLSTFIRANAEAHKAELVKYFSGNIPKYSPMALTPELDRYGEEGWELMHIEAVAPGDNQDILVHAAAGVTSWSNYYHCVFKRLKP